MEHSNVCLHCMVGCNHLHLDSRDIGEIIAVEGPEPLHGPHRHPSGLTIGTDEWRLIRCRYCEREARTPLEMISPMANQYPDGAYIVVCALCQYDLRARRKPGYRRNARYN
jgi:hypothetical protein